MQCKPAATPPTTTTTTNGAKAASSKIHGSEHANASVTASASASASASACASCSDGDGAADMSGDDGMLDPLSESVTDQVRQPDVVDRMDHVDPIEPMDLATSTEQLYSHERSPGASGHKRSLAMVGHGEEAAHAGAPTQHPCEKKLKREVPSSLESGTTTITTDGAMAAETASLTHHHVGRPNLVAGPPTRVQSSLDVANAEEIRQHLCDVRRESVLRPMIAIVTRLMFHKYNHGLFNVRVDPVEWKIPHYFEIVKNPMDLTLVKTKCLNLEYASADECAADIHLVFNNARLFNPEGHVVHECAKLLAKEFDGEYARYQTKRAAQNKLRDEHSCPSCLANVCGICNEKCINFEPPLVMCSGPCKQRIKRHSVYYKTADRSYYWCSKCFSTLPKQVTVNRKAIMLPGSDESAPKFLSKNELVKAKFIDELSEPWVQCDDCNGWVHQICALFNACENDDDDTEIPYTCPLCRLKALESTSWAELEATPSVTSVDEFPIKIRPDLMSLVGCHSPLVKRRALNKEFTRALGDGGAIQQRVLQFLQDPHASSTFGISNLPSPMTCITSTQLKSSPLSVFMQDWVRQFLLNAGEHDVAKSIVVKVVSSVKASCRVSPAIQEHFRSSTQEYPESIDYTSKAISVFQNIRGIEVCIFSMYVQEYDQTASVAANRNRTYIAYIDSLVYMRPRHIRTSLFHEILISYLGFCKAKGFLYAHIWACPTTRGGDFIYWCHPSFQKNPGKDRLLQWYMTMTEKAKRANVAFSCDDLYATSFENLEVQLKHQLPPYFDGDYWPSEVERLRANPPKRGKLSKEAYEESLGGSKFRKRLVESVRLSKESLFVIGLHPTCSSCKAVMVNEAYWKSPNGESYFCHSCAPLSDSPNLVEVNPPPFVTECGNGEVKEETSCPFLDHRADMLKNCEERHYQFDSFRRAKYSTMMLIYHVYTSQSSSAHNG